LLNSPPQDLQARVVFSSNTSQAVAPASMVGRSRKDPPTSTHESVSANGKPAIAPTSPSSFSAESRYSLNQAKLELKPNQQSTPRNRFTELIATKNITFGLALFAALIAAGLGALHALEPGHGKTIVAAYLVGSRGTARHALLLGMIVTISHTAGVYLLGAVTLYAQKYILPDRIYPFLAVLSGMLIAGMGCFLFLQRYVGTEFAHKHSYEFSSDDQAASQTVQRRPGNVSVRQLLVLGTTGGIIPCPAALVVLLSATALHRTVFGLYLIVAFSVGLAAVLITMGLAVVFAGNVLSRWRLEGPLLQRWLPMASAAVIVLIGIGIAARGLISAGVVQFRM
jgi:ABC-type nickel/cobalt efflux system permease component RcnA